MAIVALDQNTAKFLTTAQVVTSVSTAVKELVENAIDAGANSIDIKLEDNGASLIEVSDNGKGIAEADAPFMALQSYTSKIKDFGDLEKLESYGFRGEALSSLCRVADATIITRTEQDEAARLYRMNHDGSIKSFERSHRSKGTTIQAKSLFQDLPVRRQMLTNGRHGSQDVKILETLLRNFAICQPKIAISYRVNGNVVFAKPSTNTYRENLACLLGKKFVSQIDTVEEVTPDVDIHLTIPRKDITDLSDVCSSGQHVFINQRPVSYKEIEKMVNRRLIEYFGAKIPVRKKVGFLLILKVAPADVDVNLEPNKTSVLLTKQAIIVETLDEILVKYYEIKSRTEEESLVDKPARGNDSTAEYHDCTSTIMETASDAPSAKKRKIEDKTGKPTTRKTSAVKRIPAFGADEQTPKKPRVAMKLFETPGKKVNGANKENQFTNLNGLKESLENCPTEGTLEPISQLPYVDLGEDFSAQEILDLPSLDPLQVSAILGSSSDEKMQRSSAESGNAAVLTEEAWSKGRVSIDLHGGTDVHIYNHAVKDSISEVETAPADHNSAACRGFSKFSKEIRAEIIRENPGINYVETAKMLTSRWKKLSPEERGYYRDLAAAEKSQQRSHDASVNSTKVARQRVSDEEAENNKKRLLHMLDKMKHKPGKKKEALLRTVVPWNVVMETVVNSVERKQSNADSERKDIVIGRLNENVWLARTGCQIWALTLDHLFDGLGLEKPEAEEITRETIEDLVTKWLREKEDLSLLHPVFELG